MTAKPVDSNADKRCVIIEVRGGNVVAVHSNAKGLDVNILDWDNRGNPDADRENARLAVEAKTLGEDKRQPSDSLRADSRPRRHHPRGDHP